MFRKKALAAAATGLMLVSSFSGCAQSAKTSDTVSEAASSASQTSNYKGEDATITFWNTYSSTSEAVVFEKVLEAFNEKYPNIKINSVNMPTDNLQQEVLTAAATNSAPDVMRMDVSWIPQFANLSTLVNLENYYGFDDIKGDAYDACMNTCLYQGDYYAIPLDTNTKCAIYNTASLKEAGLSSPPATWDELVQAAKSIQSGHSNGLIGIGGTSTWSCGAYFMSLGGTFCDKNYTVASGYINSKESIAALQELVDLYKQGIVAGSILGEGSGTWEGVSTDSTGYMMIDEGPWFFTTESSDVTSKVTLSTIPKGNGGSVSIVGGEDLVMFKNCSDHDAAWEFMKFLTSEDAQVIMATEANQMTPFKSIAGNSQITSNTTFETYSAQLETAWARIPSASWAEMDQDISEAFEAAFRGTDTAENLLNNLASELDKLFAQG